MGDAGVGTIANGCRTLSAGSGSPALEALHLASCTGVSDEAGRAAPRAQWLKRRGARSARCRACQAQWIRAESAQRDQLRRRDGRRVSSMLLAGVYAGCRGLSALSAGCGRTFAPRLPVDRSAVQCGPRPGAAIAAAGARRAQPALVSGPERPDSSEKSGKSRSARRASSPSNAGRVRRAARARARKAFTSTDDACLDVVYASRVARPDCAGSTSATAAAAARRRQLARGHRGVGRVRRDVDRHDTVSYHNSKLPFRARGGRQRAPGGRSLNQATELRGARASPPRPTPTLTPCWRRPPRPRRLSPTGP